MAITADKKKRTGALRQRVTFQREEFISDGMGNEFPDFVDDFTVWADIRPVRGSQRLQLDAVNQEVTHEVTVRHRADVSYQGRRMKYNGRFFNVHFVYSEGEEDAYDYLMAAEINQPV